ncbi:hypothetical protein AVEN_67773-1 [Araneus ventricosus]|uniref:Uncharacterized protein n=1 Tax=Araneus ventricosus TaxID=182803 RepID=A0A4Y2HN68_ARAVE|nr:hypothetical protein AVEN_67773-1 [Araneus ventricosus]
MNIFGFEMAKPAHKFYSAFKKRKKDLSIWVAVVVEDLSSLGKELSNSIGSLLTTASSGDNQTGSPPFDVNMKVYQFQPTSVLLLGCSEALPTKYC